MSGQARLKFRNDDIYLTKSPRYGTVYYNLDKFKQAHKLLKGQEHYLAIVASEIDTYPKLTKYILKHKQDFKFGLHGWGHDDYGRYENALEDLERAKAKIEKTFKTKIKWFFPPWNRWNNYTLEICEKLGLIVNTDYSQMPNPEPADFLCFHYWNDEEMEYIKQWLTQL